MQTVFNILTLTLLTVILILNLFPLLKVSKTAPSKAVKETKSFYSLTIDAKPSILKFLLKENATFSYIDGKVYLNLQNKETFKKLLSLYEETKKREKKLKLVSQALIPLIEDDIKEVQKRLKELKEDYERLKKVLQSQKMVPDFSPFQPLVVEKQRETFEGFLKYWDQKREQLLNGFKTVVKEPEINLKDLETKAMQFYGNELQAKLFNLYLKISVLESRLEADTYKLKEYGG